MNHIQVTYADGMSRYGNGRVEYMTAVLDDGCVLYAEERFESGNDYIHEESECFAKLTCKFIDLVKACEIDPMLLELA